MRSLRRRGRIERPAPFIPTPAGWTGRAIPCSWTGRLNPDAPGDSHTPPQPIHSFASLTRESIGRRSCSLRCPQKSAAGGRFLGSEKSPISRDAGCDFRGPVRSSRDPRTSSRLARRSCSSLALLCGLRLAGSRSFLTGTTLRFAQVAAARADRHVGWFTERDSVIRPENGSEGVRTSPDERIWTLSSPSCRHSPRPTSFYPATATHNESRTRNRARGPVFRPESAAQTGKRNGTTAPPFGTPLGKII